MRKEYNLPKAVPIRQYEEVTETPLGYRAQVDFGQVWANKPDGYRIKLYFFEMVLSNSRYKYIWWFDKPFQLHL